MHQFRNEKEDQTFLNFYFLWVKKQQWNILEFLIILSTSLCFMLNKKLFLRYFSKAVLKHIEG